MAMGRSSGAPVIALVSLRSFANAGEVKVLEQGLELKQSGTAEKSASVLRRLSAVFLCKKEEIT